MSPKARRSESEGAGSGRPYIYNQKQCANPIFESWIMEWKEAAEAKDSKMKYVYAKALQSLRKYPLSLGSGKECSILENFGAHMCKMIDDRMNKKGLVPASPVASASRRPLGLTKHDLVDYVCDKAKTPKKRKKAKADSASVAPLPVSMSTSGPPRTGGCRMGLSSQPVPLTEADLIDITAPKRPKKAKVDSSSVAQAPFSVPLSSPPPTGLVSKTKPPPKRKDKLNPDVTIDAANDVEPVRKKPVKAYVPAYRSGGYAIMLALFVKEYDSNYRGYMTKTELSREAQRYCDISFVKVNTRGITYYPAWNSMKILITKELVSKRGNPALYSLSEAGRELAKKLAKIDQSVKNYITRTQFAGWRYGR